MTELKPCPFCGSPPVEPWMRDWENSYSAYCSECGCIGPSARSEEEAVNLWNRRWKNERRHDSEHHDQEAG